MVGPIKNMYFLSLINRQKRQNAEVISCNSWKYYIHDLDLWLDIYK